MIANSDVNILLVGDFNDPDATTRLLPIKETLTSVYHSDVRIIDLRQMVIDGQPSVTLEEPEIIHQAARLLEAIVEDHGVTKPAPTADSRGHDVSVLFGRSAMLAVGITGPKLFINAEFDPEWPWKDQYDATLKATDNYYYRFIEGTIVRRPGFVAFPTHAGKANCPAWLYLSTDENDIWKFSLRYPRIVMSDPELIDPARLAKTIHEFSCGEIAMKVFEIDRCLRTASRANQYRSVTVTFRSPVELHDGRRALAIKALWALPSGIPPAVVHIEGDSNTSDLDSFHNRQDLEALYDAVDKTLHPS